MYKLSIIIPCFNKFNFTSACLNDLFRLPEDHEIIIVDNGSIDGTISLANIKRPNFRYIRNNENEGFARACDRGFKQSLGNAVMFLNNDIRVSSDHETWTGLILNDLQEDTLVGPTIGVLTPELNFVKETDKPEGFHWYMSGWNMTATRLTYDKLTLQGDEGPFSSEYGLAYFEDTDMSFRAKELGMSFRIQPIPVVHFGRVTSQSVGLSSLYGPAQQIFKKKWLK